MTNPALPIVRITGKSISDFLVFASLTSKIPPFVSSEITTSSTDLDVLLNLKLTMYRLSSKNRSATNGYEKGRIKLSTIKDAVDKNSGFARLLPFERINLIIINRYVRNPNIPVVAISSSTYDEEKEKVKFHDWSVLNVGRWNFV